jgi:hypothetical protein
MKKILYLFLPFLTIIGCGASATEIEAKVRAELKKQQDSISLIKNNLEELSDKYEGEWTSECELDIYYTISIHRKKNKFYFEINWEYSESKSFLIDSKGAIEADKILNNNDGGYSCYFTIDGKPVSLKLYYVERSVITVTMVSPQKASSSIVLFNCSTIQDQDEFFKLEEKYRTVTNAPVSER